MKDKDLREKVDERLADIGVRNTELHCRVVELEDLKLSILPCPRCKHETIHQFWPCRGYVGWGTYVINDQTEDFHRCLNCGGDWVYGTETVATKYMPPKKG